MAPPSKRAKRNKIALSAPRILNTTSPVLNQDIHGFLTTVLSPAHWPQYSDEEKVKVISLLPAAYRNYNLDLAGSLMCPVDLEFLQNDGYVKAGVARFKRDLEAGVWEEKWQRDAHKAMQERKEGKFDQYLKDRAEEQFGDENSHDGDREADGDDPDSGSG